MRAQVTRAATAITAASVTAAAIAAFTAAAIVAAFARREDEECAPRSPAITRAARG